MSIVSRLATALSRSQFVNAACVPSRGRDPYTYPALSPSDSRRLLRLLRWHRCKGRRPFSPASARGN
jgi:hypothetical protein